MVQPSTDDNDGDRAAPRVMTIGNRSITFISSVLPTMISGIDIARPTISSGTRSASGALSAAPATAITLSRLITTSATRILRIAAIIVPSTLTSPFASLSTRSWIPIQSSSTAPIALR